MTTAQIIDVQNRIGAEPDGRWGPMSAAACKRYLRSLMPCPNPWPESDQHSLTEFYGAAGDESNLTNLSVVGLGVRYDGTLVQSVRVHRRCAESLLRVLTAIGNSPHYSILREYAGCFANRNTRGGRIPSLHARGAAIDIAPEANGNITRWPERATMPLDVLEMFAREGWLSGGGAWGRDAMHFHAARQ